MSGVLGGGAWWCVSFARRGSQKTAPFADTCTCTTCEYTMVMEFYWHMYMCACIVMESYLRHGQERGLVLGRDPPAVARHARPAHLHICFGVEVSLLLHHIHSYIDTEPSHEITCLYPPPVCPHTTMYQPQTHRPTHPPRHASSLAPYPPIPTNSPRPPARRRPPPSPPPP